MFVETHSCELLVTLLQQLGLPFCIFLDHKQMVLAVVNFNNFIIDEPIRMW